MNVYCLVSRTINISEPTKKLNLVQPLAYSNSKAHCMRVTVVNEDGTDADLTGIGVSASFKRSDGNTVEPINGTATGNVAEVILPGSCYVSPGRFTFTMDLTKPTSTTGISAFSSSTAYAKGDLVTYSGVVYRFTAAHPAGAWTGTDVVPDGATRTVLWVDGMVEKNTTGTIVDPGTPVGNISQAIGNANAAASSAEAAAVSASDAAANATNAAKYIAPSEASSIATLAHAVGEYFVYNGKLYVAAAAISVGGTITPNTNCTEVTGGLGADVHNLKNELSYYERYIDAWDSPNVSKSILNNVDVGETVSTTLIDNTVYGCQIISVTKNEKIKITGTAPVNNYRLWAFTDKDYKLISKAPNGASVTDEVLLAPADGYMICNFKWAVTKGLSRCILNDNETPFVGKKVAWYGDSIILNGWWWATANRFSMNSTNCGVYGTTISGSGADSMCQTSRINGTYATGGIAIPNDAEYIIIGAGTNDWAQNVALGEKNVQYDSSWQIVEDVTTFYQACHVMFRRLKEQRPNANVIVLGTPFGKMINRDGFTNKYGILNNQGLSSLDYGNALCDIAEMWGYYSIRYGNKMGINDENAETLLDPSSETGSHLHPTTDAAKEMFRNATYSGLSYLKQQ